MNCNVSSMNEKGENRGIVADNPYYGTFHGVTNYYPPQQNQFYPSPSFFPSTPYQQQGYPVLPVYAVAERRPLGEPRLPCCGLGLGWFLFVIGWFFGGVPWYIGTFVLIFVQMDCREKPGLIACAVASFVTLVVFALGVRQGDLQKLI